jgi:transposase
VAPIPVWSGSTAGRVRMTRSVNRQLNAALHRIAVTQIRLDGLGRAYERAWPTAIRPPKPCVASNAAWPGSSHTSTLITKPAIALPTSSGLT